MTITLKSPGSPTPTPAPQPVPPPVLPPKKPRRWGKRLFIAVILLAAIAAVFYACLFAFSKYKQSNGTANTNNPTDVVVEVGKLMLLPAETPTIAVVSDLTKLQGQKFFANAHQGDIVLMYATAQKAVLYSPSKNMIIEVAPIVNNEPSQ